MTVHELMKILQNVDNDAEICVIGECSNPIDDYYGIGDAYVLRPCCSNNPSRFYLVEG